MSSWSTTLPNQKEKERNQEQLGVEAWIEGEAEEGEGVEEGGEVEGGRQRQLNRVENRY